MKRGSIYLTLAVLLLAGAWTSTTRAQVSEMTKLVLTEPTDVGGTIVPAGVYLIRVVPLNTTRNVLQITDEERTEVFATVLSVPHALPPAERDSENATFVFYPETTYSPRALRTWYAPDPVSGGGHDIVYPESRAREIADAAQDSVVAYAGEPSGERELEVAELHVISPEPVVAENPERTDESMTTLSESEETSIAEGREELVMDDVGDEDPALPQTAGNGALLLLVGTTSLVAALGVRRWNA